MSKQKVLPVEPLIQCEAGRAKTMQRQSLYSPRTPKWPPRDKGELDNQPISRVEHTKLLGLIIDDRLSRSNHIRELCRKMSSAIGALRRIRSLISQSTAVQIYNALIQPHFDYCAPVWDGLSSYLCEKLQKLQTREARVTSASQLRGKLMPAS